MSSNQDMSAKDAVYDIVVVGAGFAGIYLLHRFREAGYSVKVFEAAGDVGGVWYWNRYPGARCDIESLQYSYSFSEDLQQEWNWKERFATQPEILAYINHVVERFDLRRDIALNQRITSVKLDETGEWHVETESARIVRAHWVIMATGVLSAAKPIDIPGLELFNGEILRTSHWPHEGVDLTGKKVAIIGTGSSAVQTIPEIAGVVDSLHVFQRTPSYSVPARNRDLTPEQRANWKSRYAEFREKARQTRTGALYDFGTVSALEVDPAEVDRELSDRWDKGGTNFMYAYTDIARDRKANELVANFVRERIAATVTDQDVAASLTPVDYPIGAKRICVDTGYFEAFNLPNVSLVDLRKSPIRAITAAGIRTTDNDFTFDTIIFATGFDAMTGALLRANIQGRNCLSLNEAWAEGPKTYLGMMSAGFPNLFFITGPGSPSVISNMIVSIEHDVEWIGRCIDNLRARGIHVIEPTVDAQSRWMEHVANLAAQTLYLQANSWYLGANVPGKPRIFMPYIGGVDQYQRECQEVEEAGYPGFMLQ